MNASTTTPSTITFTSEGGFHDDALPTTMPRRRRQGNSIDSEIAAIFSAPGTARERLDAFLAVTTDRRPGGPAVRERQKITQKRLDAVAQPAPDRVPVVAPWKFIAGIQENPPSVESRTVAMRLAAARWTPRSCRWTAAERAELRAHAVRDDRTDSGTALALAKSFHVHVKSLYTSKRGGVAYGAGGQRETDWNAYSKRYGFPARWRNAGVYVSYPGSAPVAVIQTARGAPVAQIPLPSAAGWRKRKWTGAQLLDGDLYSVRRQVGGAIVHTRYGWTKKAGWTKTGIALELPGGSFEHGATVADCRAELVRKAEVARQQAEARRLSARLERAAHLIGRLCPSLVVTHDDRRQVGYCDAGVVAFLDRYPALKGRDQVMAAELRATGRSEVERPIAAAARRVAMARFVS